MIKQEEVYKIGRIGKAHGVKGEVTFMFDDDVFDRVDADYLILEVDGILVPFFMEEYRFRTDSTANILFEMENGMLIPANDDLITHIDKDNKTITTALPEGILDL